MNSIANKIVPILGLLSYRMCHNNMCRPHHEALKAIIQQCNIPIHMQSKLDFHNACCLNKDHMLPLFSYISSYTTPLEYFICLCVGSCTQVSFLGYKYLLTCVYAFANYTWTFLSNLKSEVYVTHTHFITHIANQFNTTLKIVQTNGGGEFQPLLPFFTQHGIVHRKP